MPGFADFADFAGVVEITRLNTSEFLYYLDEVYGNELVFAFSLSLQTTLTYKLQSSLPYCTQGMFVIFLV